MIHIVAGWLTVVVVFPKLTPFQKEERFRLWALELLAKLAIKLVVVGSPPGKGPWLLACNHLSWLDIIVLRATCCCQFISKSDVRQWPLIGTLASGTGTLFVERASRRDAMRVVHQMVERLRDGCALAIFPEGTTSQGSAVLPFHANLFQAAIFANVAVVPAALRFTELANGERSLAPCYTGDATLLGSIWRTLSAPPLSAVLCFGKPQLAQGRDRRTWASDLHLEVVALNRS